MAIRNDGEVLACPNYRIAEFHANQGDARPLGNVLIDGVAKVWNSERYRIARQSTIKAPTDDNKQFCFGCKYLYKTDIDLNIKAASDFHLDGTSIK
jgi:MoaA/NifB/PqqE/SkfB family radical SAM enzyme